MTDRAGSLALVDMSGSPFDVGVQLGRFGAAAVHEVLRPSRIWADVMARRDGDLLHAFAACIETRFPGIGQELRGLSEGLGVPFGEVLAWNCRGDLWAMAPDGCTTVLVPGSRRVVAHNEDGLPVLRGRCALARVAVDGGLPFTAFVYPGSIPGHTFGVNGAGLVSTVNNIRARGAGAGVPRMVLARAVLDAPTLDDAVAVLRDAPRAGAFHLSLARAGDERLLSVEFTATAMSVEDLPAPSVHANHLVHATMETRPQTVTASSASRQDRGRALVAAGRAIDPLAILRDVDGPGLPIRRDDPDDPDDENTLATALFVIEGTEVRMEVHDRTAGSACFTARFAIPANGIADASPRDTARADHAAPGSGANGPTRPT